MTLHYHAAWGEPEDVGYCADLLDVARVLSDECKRASDYLYEGADVLADMEDYKGAWDTLRQSRALDVLAHNLDVDKRASAPLYQGHPERLVESMKMILDRDFPIFLPSSGIITWTSCTEDCAPDDTEG